MGCCFGKEDDGGYSDQDVNERSSLLHNPVSDGASNRPASSYNTQPAPPERKGNEQSALERILHQTANNVIDVSAIDSQTMEQHEYMDRARHYNAKMALTCQTSPPIRSTLSLPAGVAAPHGILAAQPVSQADIQLITNTVEQASKAIKDVKVRHKEDLVVPFGVP